MVWILPCRFELKWRYCLSVVFANEHTNVTCVGNILCRAKIKDVRGCADECAFSLYVYMHALRARVCMYVCVRVQYMRNKKTSLVAF